MSKHEIAQTERSFASVQKFFHQKQESIASLLPMAMDPLRLLRVALGQIRKNPKLMECTQESLFQCMIESATYGLEIGSFNSCWMVPFKNEATLVVGYGGLLDLARRGGGVKACPHPAGVRGRGLRGEGEHRRRQHHARDTHA